MSIYKIPLPLNILEAAKERITGHLTPYPVSAFLFRVVKIRINAASDRRTCPTNGQKICVLFIDWEAQFSCTINYVQSLRELYTDVIEEFYWVALPLTTQNSLSQYQPEWQCWEPDVEWVRQPRKMR